MKKLKASLLTLILSLFVACGPSLQEMREMEDKKANAEYVGGGLKVVTIDSCEYIMTVNTTGYYFFLLHKANCRNQIHKTSKTQTHEKF